MKILMLFCDMLRANKLTTVNKNIRRPTPFDNWLNEFGGCSYVNCYTPGPDTPRSLACLYTSLYPKSNGCKTRIEWPGFYLNEDLQTMFQFLNKNRFKIYTNFPESSIQVGICTEKDLKVITNYTTFLDLINKKKIKGDNQNEVFFIYLNDFHHCISDFDGLPIGLKVGQKKLLDSFNIFFKKYNKDIFDFTFIFSDHGCLLKDDLINSNEKFYLLNDNRSKIFMHLRKKGDKYLSKDYSLRTIMDIYPTISDILAKPLKFESDGISLMSKRKRKFVIMEDSTQFTPHVGINSNIWRYKELNFSLYLDPNIKKIELEDNFKKFSKVPNSKLILNKILKRVKDISCAYKEIYKRQKILSFYSTINEQTYFSDGTLRTSKISTNFYKLLSKVFKTFVILKDKLKIK